MVVSGLNFILGQQTIISLILKPESNKGKKLVFIKFNIKKYLGR